MFGFLSWSMHHLKPSPLPTSPSTGMAGAAGRTWIDSDKAAHCSGLGSNEVQSYSQKRQSYGEVHSSPRSRLANGTHTRSHDTPSFFSLASTVGQESVEQHFPATTNVEQAWRRDCSEVGAFDLDFAGGDTNKEGDDPSLSPKALQSPCGPAPAQVSNGNAQAHWRIGVIDNRAGRRKYCSWITVALVCMHTHIHAPRI